MNSFDKSVLNYCLKHPEEEISQYMLKQFEESAARKKAEIKRWRLIGLALQNYERH